MNPVQKDIPLIEYFIARFWIWIFNKIPNHGIFDKWRMFSLRLSGIKITNKVKVFSPLSISPKTRTKNIILNGFLFINAGSRFSAPGDSKITISQNCLVGPNVIFETVNHGLVYKTNEPRGAILGDIVLGEGVWIGCNVILLQNVSIGTGAVVAAGSVVTKSVNESSVVGGIPAKLIKQIHVSEK